MNEFLNLKSKNLFEVFQRFRFNENFFRALNDVAYGTRSYRIQEPTGVESELIEQAIELERGQNLIEIHISRATFSERALEFFGKGNEPSTFCSIEFFEHELQMSPIVKGRIPEFNFTAQYTVNVDDFLLYYLQKEYTLIELHQTIGQAFQTVAACQLNLKQLVEGTHERIHGTAKLIGSHAMTSEIGVFGAIEFWVRLRVPMEQAFRLLKEKMKAQGYLATTSRSAKAADEPERERDLDPNINELTIGILNCSNVKSMVPGKENDSHCFHQFIRFSSFFQVNNRIFTVFINSMIFLIMIRRRFLHQIIQILMIELNIQFKWTQS